MCTVNQAYGLACAAHLDAHHPEQAAVKPGPTAQTGDVPGSIRVIGHQKRLRRDDLRAVRTRYEPCSAVALQQVREEVQGRAQLLAPVRRGLDDFGVRTERCVVDERLAADHPKVDTQFDPIGQCGQARRRVFTIQPQIEGKVVARTRSDHHERDTVLGGHAGRQGLRAVAPGDAKQIGPTGHGLASHFSDVDWFRTAHQEHLSAKIFSLALQVELPDLPAAGLRVHDQERVGGAWRRRALGHAPVHSVASQR